MQFELSEEDAAIVQTVRSFIDKEVMPYEPLAIRREIEGEPGDLTQSELRALQEKGRTSGLWGVATPAAFGGAGLSKLTEVLTRVELGRTFLNFNFGGYASPSLFAISEEQQERYLRPVLEGSMIFSLALSEPGVGSDARGLRTTATPVQGGWVINGEKNWISNGDIADVAIVFALTPEVGAAGAISAFLVERQGGWTATRMPVMGMYTPSSLVFENVFVQRENLVGELGHGLRYAAAFIHPSRLNLAAENVGSAERVLSMAVEYAKERVTFGRPLSTRENIQWMIADAEVSIRAAKLLTLHAASQFDRGLDYRHAACAAKLHAARMANAVVDDVLQIFGAMGYAKECAVERFYRDLRVARIFGGSDEMQRIAIQQDLFSGAVQIGDVF